MANGIGVIALVGVQDRALGHLLQKQISGAAIGDLATGQEESDRAAQAIGQGVDLRGSPTARPANRLILLPPLPAEAQRCAFMAEESIRTSAGGPPALAARVGWQQRLQPRKLLLGQPEIIAIHRWPPFGDRES